MRTAAKARALLRSLMNFPDGLLEKALGDDQHIAGQHGDVGRDVAVAHQPKIFPLLDISFID